MQKFALKKFLIILIKMFFICSFAKMSDKEPERINKKESPIETEDCPVSQMHYERKNLNDIVEER